MHKVSIPLVIFFFFTTPVLRQPSPHLHNVAVVFTNVVSDISPVYLYHFQTDIVVETFAKLFLNELR